MWLMRGAAGCLSAEGFLLVGCFLYCPPLMTAPAVRCAAGELWMRAQKGQGFWYQRIERQAGEYEYVFEAAYGVCLLAGANGVLFFSDNGGAEE